ncbi:MAG: hypothetical protein HYR91_04065 [Flavobacteriia bacterium]|nr:hypothetical protein [Flavobacteriia bacterium]
MGAIKLAYKEESSPLKVVYRASDENQKIVQRWTSLDPEMASFPDDSPYCSMGNNPISNIDPDGDFWGALIEYGWQVTGNLIQGKGAYKSFIGDVDFVSVGAELIPGAGKALKMIKQGLKLYSDFVETTVDGGTRVKSGEEILVQYAAKYGAKKLSKKLKKMTSEKTAKRLEDRKVHFNKKINNLKGNGKKAISIEKQKKLNMYEQKLAEVKKVENINKIIKSSTNGQYSQKNIENAFKTISNTVAKELSVKIDEKNVIDEVKGFVTAIYSTTTNNNNGTYIYRRESDLRYLNGTVGCEVTTEVFNGSTKEGVFTNTQDPSTEVKR